MFTIFGQLFIKLTQARLLLHPLRERVGVRVKKLSKKSLTGLITLVVVILPTALLILFNSAKTVEAAWVNEDWGYRYPITVTNSTGSTQTNLQKLLTIDTSTLVTAGKLQSDCDDLRFTAQNGTVLPYYIDSGCNTTTTKVWVLIDSLPTNGSVIYMYYGNPGAVAGSSSKEFDNVVGLVGYWTMNDTSGSTATDSSVNANNGTATGTTIVSGQKGNARSFNGTSDYISVTTTGASFTVQTVEAWIYKTGDGYIIDQGGNNNWMQVYGGRIRGGTDASGYCDGSTTIASNTWYHVVKVNDGITNKIYVNGNLDCSNTIGIGSPGAITIGRYGGGGIFFPGQLDDVRIYNTARTADQISSDYTKTYTIQTSPLTVTTANGSEEKAPSPVAYWKFDDGTGTTAKDSTTNANNGTLTNGPSWQTEDMCISGKCLKFDGTDDYVSVASNNQTPTGSNARTVQMWVNSMDSSWTDNANTVFEYGAGTTRQAFGIDMLDFPNIQVYTWGDDDTVNTGLSQKTSWFHLSVTYDGSTTIRTYINGILKSTKTLGGALNTTNSAVNIGRSSLIAGAYFDGRIDEPKIYNYARSAEQIKADYNARANSEGAASRMDSGSPPGMTLSNGLVGYWKMDESSWTNNCTATSVTDSSGNSNNGKSCPATTGPTGGAAGKFGNAGSFDGSDDYITVANNSALHPSNRTLSAWVKLNAFGTNDLIAGQGAESWLSYNASAAGCSTANRFGYSIYNGSGWICIVSSSQPSTGTWYHLIGTYDGTTMKLYINGELQSSGTSSAINNGGWAFDIGSFSGELTTYALNGTIDEVRFYNRALSSAEVSGLYNFAPGPVAYYNFEENTGSTVNDRSGNGNTGTWNGSGSPHWKPGKYGASGNFDGSSDSVTVTDNGTLRPTGTITVGSWIYPTAVNGLYEIYRYDNAIGGDTNRHLLSFQGGGSHCNGGSGPCLSFGISTGGTYAELEVNITASDYLNKWNYIVATYDGATKKIYTNGVLIGSASASGAIGQPSVSDTLNIGRSSEAAEYFKGQIDDVKIYNYARTQDQIISDMQGSSGTAAFSLSSSGLTGGSNTKPAAPVGYWKFDEGYGTTANNVGNGGSTLNGTLTNMASPATSTSGWTQAGKVGKGLVFDGTDDYVSLPNDSALNITSNQITMSAWVYRTVTGDFDQVISKATGTGTSSRQYAMYIDATAGGLGCNVVAGSVVDLISSIIRVTTNTWTHISCVYDGATLKGYVNGIQASSTALTGNIVTQNTGVNIGRFNTGVSYFNGTLDEVKIYNFPLTADQVKLDMNQGAALVLGSASNNSSYEVNAANQEYCIPGDTATCAAPVGRWDFDEATGTTANDSSGNANTGTLTNGPTWKPGKVNKSINFDGSDDYVDTGTGSSLNLSGDLTLEAWFKTSDNGNVISIMTKGATNDWLFSIFKNTTNALHCKIYQAGIGSDYLEAISSSTVHDGKWHHAACTLSGTSLTLYIDGVSTGTDTSTTGSRDTTTAGSFSIGRFNWSTTYNWLGQIDQVRIFNYARSAAQVAWDYNKGAPVGHWRMDECQGGTANDASGNSNNGTLTIGASGTQTSAGTCTDGSSASAWYNGVSGKRNYSLNFDGTDDRISVNALSYSNRISIAAWVYHTDNLDTWDDIMAGGCGDILLGFGNNSLAWGGQCNSPFGTISYTTNINNAWHHVVATYDSSTLKLYVDGILVKSGSASGSFTPGTFYIGSTGSSEYYGGKIDDARVYNYALTATQVKNLMNEGAYRSGPTTGAP